MLPYLQWIVLFYHNNCLSHLKQLPAARTAGVLHLRPVTAHTASDHHRSRPRASHGGRIRRARGLLINMHVITGNGEGNGLNL